MEDLGLSTFSGCYWEAAVTFEHVFKDTLGK